MIVGSLGGGWPGPGCGFRESMGLDVAGVFGGPGTGRVLQDVEIKVMGQGPGAWRL